MKLLNLEAAFNYTLTIIECIAINNLYLVMASDNYWYLINGEIEGQFTTKDEAMEYLALCNISKAFETTIGNKGLSEHQKTMALSSLMTDMERLFNIPLLANKDWENKHLGVIHLYKRIANSRNL